MNSWYICRGEETCPHLVLPIKGWCHLLVFYAKCLFSQWKTARQAITVSICTPPILTNVVNDCDIISICSTTARAVVRRHHHIALYVRGDSASVGVYILFCRPLVVSFTPFGMYLMARKLPEQCTGVF